MPKLPATADSKGRLRTSKEQRRVILAEFERSGISAAAFAQRTGLKYSTFAAWVQRYRRTKRPVRKSPLRLLEAVATQPAPIVVPLQVQLPGGARLEISVSGRSKPARAGRMKTSHFEGRIALCEADAAQGRDEPTQRELAAFDFDFGGARLVAPADLRGNWTSTGRPWASICGWHVQNQPFRPPGLVAKVPACRGSGRLKLR